MTESRLDSSAALALCHASAGTVYRFARMVASSDHEAEDLAHDALVRVMRHAHRFDPGRGEVEGWLWRIVTNTARDHGRLASRRRALFDLLTDRQHLNPAGDAQEAAIRRLEDGELVAAVRTLPSRSRSVIALRYGADLPFESVGRYMGVSAAGARMAHQRALAQLRDALGSEAP